MNKIAIRISSLIKICQGTQMLYVKVTLCAYVKRPLERMKLHQSHAPKIGCVCPKHALQPDVSHLYNISY